MGHSVVVPAVLLAMLLPREVMQGAELCSAAVRDAQGWHRWALLFSHPASAAGGKPIDPVGLLSFQFKSLLKT